MNEFVPGTQLWKRSLNQMLAQSSTHAPPVPPKSAVRVRVRFAVAASRRGAGADDLSEDKEDEEEEDDEDDEDLHDVHRAAAAAAAVQALPLLDDSLVCLESDGDPAASRCPVCRETRAYQGDERHVGGCGRWLRLPCAHVLCVDCARKTAKVQSTCPECRAPFLPQPSTGDRVRLNFPPKRSADEGAKKKGGGGKEQLGDGEGPGEASLWETLQALLHLRSRVIIRSTQMVAARATYGCRRCCT